MKDRPFFRSVMLLKLRQASSSHKWHYTKFLKSLSSQLFSTIYISKKKKTLRRELMSEIVSEGQTDS